MTHARDIDPSCPLTFERFEWRSVDELRAHMRLVARMPRALGDAGVTLIVDGADTQLELTPFMHTTSTGWSRDLRWSGLFEARTDVLSDPAVRYSVLLHERPEPIPLPSPTVAAARRRRSPRRAVVKAGVVLVAASPLWIACAVRPASILADTTPPPPVTCPPPGQTSTDPVPPECLPPTTTPDPPPPVTTPDPPPPTTTPDPPPPATTTPDPPLPTTTTPSEPQPTESAAPTIPAAPTPVSPTPPQARTPKQAQSSHTAVGHWRPNIGASVRRGSGTHVAKTKRHAKRREASTVGHVVADAPKVYVPFGLTAQLPAPPEFLIPIYKAAGRRYQIPWRILAAINAVETGYGSNLNVSSAGAVGWMQFMPATWDVYGHSGNPYDPRDAIFAAARLLHDAGASTNLSGAIFAYNHAKWYVAAVLWQATLIDSHGKTTHSKEGYALPLDARYMTELGRTDDGVDIETAPDGAPVYSMTPGICVAVASNPGGFGPNYPVILVTAGPLAGRYVYYGHVAASLVRQGETVAAGQPIAVIGHTGDAAGLGHGHIEIGFSDGSGTPLDQHGLEAWTPSGQVMRQVLTSLSAAFKIDNR
jgi:murein DD-endopeptidase MepM/ murein hydrolase activator NlpD